MLKAQHIQLTMIVTMTLLTEHMHAPLDIYMHHETEHLTFQVTTTYNCTYQKEKLKPMKMMALLPMGGWKTIKMPAL